MPRKRHHKPVLLTEDERRTLEQWTRRPTTAQRLALRSRMVLACAEGLTALVMQQYAMVAGLGLSGYVGAPGYDALNALGALFAIVTVWPVARRIGLAYAVFMLTNILPALSAGGLLSAGRFSSVLFPAFVWLADVIPPAQRAGWIASFAALQAFNAALYYTWRPLF